MNSESQDMPEKVSPAEGAEALLSRIDDYVDTRIESALTKFRCDGDWGGPTRDVGLARKALCDTLTVALGELSR